MIFQIIALVIMLAFYGCYFSKLFCSAGKECAPISSGVVRPAL